ncbi:MAG: hypothetical protein HOY78_28450 [Saccharothrix sp.]|nr:hypothetical protein [Saccharothrix sp.]
MAAVSAALLCVPVPAGAAIPGDELVWSDAAGPTSSTSRINAVSCPSGKQLIGAWAYTRGARRDVLITALIPSATSAVALAREDEDGTAEEWSLVVEAVCALPVAGHEVVVQHSDYTSANKQVRATCPVGKKVLTAGWNTQGEGQVWVNQLAPAADLTSVAVTGMEDPDGYAGTWRLSTYAVCASPLPGLSLRSATSVVDQSDKMFDVRCGSGQRWLAAGWSFIGTGGVTPAGQVSPNLWASGTSWFQLNAWEDDDGFAYDWYAVGRAICVDRA